MSRTQTRKSAMALAAVLAVALTGATGQAQDPPPPPPSPQTKPAPPPKPLVPVQVTVVISRYQGERADKRTGSLPFTLRVNANDRGTSVRMGSEVPVPTTTLTTPKEGATPVPIPSYSIRSVGTNIDCSAETIEGGRYILNLTISDSQVQTPQKETPANLPMGFQSFSSSHRLIIRDGETIQYTTATDKSTGETVKVDVTLNVVK